MWRRGGNKFNAIPVSEGENHFDSTGEYERFKTLELMERAGEISGLRLHPKYEIEPGVSWKLDYEYTERGRLVGEDFKPRPFTPRENLLVKLWRLHGPCLLRFTSRKGKGWTVRKEIMGGGK